MLFRDTQDGQVVVKGLTKRGPLQEEMANHSSILAAENPINSMKRQKDMTPKDEPPKSEGVQYATEEEWRAITKSAGKNEAVDTKQKRHSDMYVSGGKSKVQCCKEQYCIWTWNVRSINQDNLDMVKQEMARVNIDILGISELKRTEMGEFNSDDH